MFLPPLRCARPDLLTIEDDVVFGGQVLLVGQVTLRKKAFVAANAALMPGVELEPQATIANRSSAGTRSVSMATRAATCMAVGITSFDDWP